MAAKRKAVKQPAWQVIPPSGRIMACFTFDTKREAWSDIKEHFIERKTSRQLRRMDYSVVPCDIVIRPKTTKRK